MKRNALIRIILYSLLIVILAIPLLQLLPRNSAVAIQGPVGSYSATVTEDCSLLASPSPGSEIKTQLTQGQAISYARQELVNGDPWVYVTDPETGWLQKENISDLTPTVVDFSSESSNTICLDPNSFDEIEINWAAGSIHICPSEDAFLYIREENNSQEYPMAWAIQEGQLSIDFAQQENRFLPSLNAGKDLFVMIPKDWICRSLEIDAASTEVLIEDLIFGEIELDTASGEAEFRSCTTNSLDIDTASGNISYTGAVDTVSCSAASANFTAVLTNTPSAIEMESASGYLELTLPRDTGFTVDLEGLSTELFCDYPTTIQNASGHNEDSHHSGSHHVYGDGRCRIDLNSLSGKVYIRKPS